MKKTRSGYSHTGFTLHLFQKKRGRSYLAFLEKGEGFTLTEMMVVIAISLLIIAAVYSAYSLSRRGYLAGEEIAEVTQNGRVILERISRGIRQAKEIATELPTERVNPPDEIKFQDGHLPLVSEEASAQGGTIQTITLSSTASGEGDYYKDMFIKIIEGTGVGQIRKIDNYNGTTKIAQIGEEWETIPNSTSTYKIESSFYYIHYYRGAENNIWRRIVTYCFSEDSLTCFQPETYIPWDAIPPSGQTLLEVTLESPRTIGEYVTDLEFWGSRVINVFLILQKEDKSIDFKTKIFGRNL